MTFYYNMSRELKETREKLGLTLNTVAKLSGLTPAIVKEMESGNVVIEAYEFFQVMSAYEKYTKTEKSPDV